MKYAHLQDLAKYFAKFKKISDIKRVADMLLLIDFGGEIIFFDLAKSGSAIYKNEDFKAIKIYNAPFDTMLKKRLRSAKICEFSCLENNRILKLVCELQGSYKSIKTTLYLEFTGRFTNAILCDENGVIIEALRHIDNDLRTIKPNHKLCELAPIQIKEKACESIENFDEFLHKEFERINKANLTNLKSIKQAQILKKIQNFKSLNDELPKASELMHQSDDQAKKATLLLANLTNLKSYERKFELENFDGEKIKFELDEAPKIAANKFFTNSKKLRQKALGIDAQRQNLQEKINFYTKLLALVNTAKSQNELEILQPKSKNEKKEKNQSENVKNFYISEYKISIGRNEKGNQELLKNAKKDDIWFHLKDIASPHVLLKSKKTKPDENVLRYAAKLCLSFSDVGAGNYEIDYTKRANVKILSGASVNYIDYDTIILSKE
ncbi:MAG: NFACT RNA binding domain-containing protein [Campylobacter sp.]|nr:NFACT RNA binding domain-containing protein [Campylobacter sp.]